MNEIFKLVKMKSRLEPSPLQGKREHAGGASRQLLGVHLKSDGPQFAANPGLQTPS